MSVASARVCVQYVNLVSYICSRELGGGWFAVCKRARGRGLAVKNASRDPP